MEAEMELQPKQKEYIEAVKLWLDFFIDKFSLQNPEFLTIDQIMDADGINYWTKIVEGIETCIFPYKSHTKIDLDKFLRFAEFLSQRTKEMQSWTYKHRFVGIKVEVDELEPGERIEENQECTKKKLLAAEK